MIEISAAFLNERKEISDNILNRKQASYHCSNIVLRPIKRQRDL